MKLSERLRNAVGVGPFSHAVSDESPVVVTAGLLREASELARSVEDAPCAVAGQSPGRFYYVGGSAPVEHGQRVRIVPEQGEGWRVADRQFAYCCAAFAEQAMNLQAMAGGGFAYPASSRPHSQFEPDTETDTWNINGCCGGGCFVVTDMRYCPYCGSRLVNPLVPEAGLGVES